MPTQHAIPLESVNEYHQNLTVNGHTTWCTSLVLMVLQRATEMEIRREGAGSLRLANDYFSVVYLEILLKCFGVW